MLGEALDVRREHLDLLLGLLDGAGLLSRGVVAELLVGGELNLLRMLLLLALRGHALHELDHLAHKMRGR